MTPEEVVRAYWDDMGSNDFARAARWFADDFRLYWPQSREVIEDRADFAALNAAYPAKGLWRFRMNRIVASDRDVVSDVTVSDGTTTARAVTFHRVLGDRICEQVEYWPDDYPAPDWRSRWVRHGLPEE
ncbi:MAG: nuclear transport factor 2 family protein [Albidovulum sp.]|uniref:nuclear transport factor 2 family protein n=1 Tax=Albidovulum sp. TaxID=1872424 RepID=UPI003CC3F353